MGFVVFSVFLRELKPDDPVADVLLFIKRLLSYW